MTDKMRDSYAATLSDQQLDQLLEATAQAIQQMKASRSHDKKTMKEISRSFVDAVALIPVERLASGDGSALKALMLSTNAINWASQRRKLNDLHKFISKELRHRQRLKANEDEDADALELHAAEHAESIIEALRLVDYAVRLRDEKA